MSTALAPERLEALRPVLTVFPSTTFSGPNDAYIDMVESVEPGQVVLDRRYSGGLSQSGLLATFREDDALMEGRRGGVHHSYAGYLTLGGRKDQNVLRAVFVKPFLNARDCRNVEPVEHMVQEVAASDAIARLYPYPVTFKTLGVARSYNGTPQLLTEFNLSVTALSNIFRPKNNFSPPPTTDQLVKGIHIAMYQAGAWLGGLGAAHRDFHVGNTARGIEYTPWFNDNETVVPLEKSAEVIQDTDDNRVVVLGDLNRFFHSTVNPNFTRPDVARKVFSILDNPQRMGAFLKTYQHSIAQNTAVSGLVVPERYYMTTGTFTGLALTATKAARQKFTNTGIARQSYNILDPRRVSRINQTEFYLIRGARKISRTMGSTAHRGRILVCFYN